MLTFVFQWIKKKKSISGKKRCFDAAHVCVTGFTLCGVPRFSGWKWKFMKDRWMLPFLPPPPPAFESSLEHQIFTISPNGEVSRRLTRNWQTRSNCSFFPKFHYLPMRSLLLKQSWKLRPADLPRIHATTPLPYKILDGSHLVGQIFRTQI